jgi:hypothetical protein
MESTQTSSAEKFHTGGQVEVLQKQQFYFGWAGLHSEVPEKLGFGKLLSIWPAAQTLPHYFW